MKILRNIAEVAEYCGVSPQTIHRARKRGDLPEPLSSPKSKKQLVYIYSDEQLDEIIPVLRARQKRVGVQVRGVRAKK